MTTVFPVATARWYRFHVKWRGQFVVQADTREALDIEIAKYGKRLRHVEPLRTHICSICDKYGVWGPEWLWFGSIKELDDDAPIIKICSESCRIAAVEKGLVPFNARRLDAKDAP